MINWLIYLRLYSFKPWSKIAWIFFCCLPGTTCHNKHVLNTLPRLWPETNVMQKQTPVRTSVKISCASVFQQKNNLSVWQKPGLLTELCLACCQRHTTELRLSVWSDIWQVVEGLPITRVLLDAFSTQESRINYVNTAYSIGTRSNFLALGINKH